MLAGFALTSAPVAARPGPDILNAHFDSQPVAGLPADLLVKVRDPLAAVNGLQIDFGDGSMVKLSACRSQAAGGPAPEGVFGAGHPVTFKVSHTYAAGGRFAIHIVATAGDCSALGLAISSQDVHARVIGAPKLPGAPKLSGGHGALALAAASSPCPNALASASAVSPRAMRTAILCLVNYLRAVKGLGRLHTNRKLTRAAQVHASDMVRRSYFSHQTPDGADLLARLARARFRPRGAAGENLAAGTGAYDSPLGVLFSWMFSPPHLANMLHPSFRIAGIGVARGMPGTGDTDAGTYDMTFADR